MGRRAKGGNDVEMRSTNGQWGIDISGWPDRGGPIQRGTIRALGHVAGFECFQFEPDPAANTWIYAAVADVEPVHGATTVARRSMQSNAFAVVLLLSDLAVVRWTGYKGRSSGYRQIVNGEESRMSRAALLAAGLIEPATPPEPVEAPPAAPAALRTHFAEVLSAAIKKEEL